MYTDTCIYINSPRLHVRSDFFPVVGHPTEQCVLGIRMPQMAVRANSTLQGEPSNQKTEAWLAAPSLLCSERCHARDMLIESWALV